jgi:uncharacterized protein (TIGR02118 family)
MIRVSVLYPAKEGAKFDLGYYKDKHMPLVQQRLGPLGLVRLEIDRGMAGGTPNSPAPYPCIGHLYFNSLGEFQKAMGTHGNELMADVPNYTNITPHVQISEIVS